MPFSSLSFPFGALLVAGLFSQFFGATISEASRTSEASSRVPSARVQALADSLLSSSVPRESVLWGFVDVDRDGEQELLVSALSEETIYVAKPSRLSIDREAVTAIEVGGPILGWRLAEIHRPDGIEDLAVITRDESGPVILFFLSTRGGLFSRPTIERFDDEILALEIGHLNEDGFVDLAVATRSELVLLHGNDARPESLRSFDTFVDREVYPLPGQLGALYIEKSGSRGEASRLRVEVDDGEEFRLASHLNEDGLLERRLDYFGPSAARRVESTLDRGVSTLSVNSTDDSDDGSCNAIHCSLREAILAANAGANLDTIVFDAIPGATITPISALPDIVEPLVIDGATSSFGKVGLSGVLAHGSGLTLRSSGNTIRGLVISEFEDGILLSTGSGSTVEGNFIGTTADGELAAGNSRCGIEILASSNNQIGGAGAGQGNLISGNDTGICIDQSSSDTIIEGNFIGTDVGGVDRVANTGGGLDITDSAGTRIGSAAAGNLISGNQSGVLLVRATGTIIQGNLFGPSVTGDALLSDGEPGNDTAISLRDTSDATIGGVGAGQSNQIAGNDSAIEVIGIVAADNTVIQGNLVGVKSDGVSALGNGRNIWFSLTTQGATIGGLGAGGNVVANAASGPGIFLNGAGTSHEMLSNSIFDNEGLGIALGSPDRHINDPGDADGGKNRLQNSPFVESVFTLGADVRARYRVDSAITSSAYDLTVQFFESDSPASGEGKRLLATDTFTEADLGGGIKTFTLGNAAALGIGPADSIVATATDASGNTSEFSLPRYVDRAVLTITLAGVGAGTVTSVPTGIDCGSDCSEIFLAGQGVTLSAAPGPGSKFVGWSGDADCLDGVVDMDVDLNCTATFQPQVFLTLFKIGSGEGSVVSSPAGIDCGSTCSAEFEFGQIVDLQADATPGSLFVGYGGDSDCTNGSILLDDSVTCTAVFDLNQNAGPILTITKTGTGSGRVTTDPAGIDCGTTCAAEFQTAESLDLIATPDPGSVFVGFSGDPGCSSGSFQISNNTECAAEFATDLSLGDPEFDFQDFSSTSGLQFLSGAAEVDDNLSLTSAGRYLAGAVWYQEKLNLKDGFETRFTFQIPIPNPQSGTGVCQGVGQADGLAFVMQNQGPDAIGGPGFGLGYATGEDSDFEEVLGIPTSLAIEFDTWRNEELPFPNFYDEPDDNHVSVQDSGEQPNVGDPDFALAYGTPSADLNDGLPHQVRIVYLPGRLEVLVDGESVIREDLDLSSSLAFDPEGLTYVGFTAGTGECYQEHLVTSWTLGANQILFWGDYESGDTSAWSAEIP